MPSAHSPHPRLYFWIRPVVFLGLIAGVCAGWQPTWAEDSSVPTCWSEKPVVDINLDWNSAELGTPLNELLGPVRLPLAAWRPEVMTYAQLRWLRKNGEQKAFNSFPDLDTSVEFRHTNNRGALNSGTVEVEFSFPDPRPFGLPYTVQGFIIESATGQIMKDWSNECEDPGVSVFPGQIYRELIYTQETPLDVNDLGRVHLQVWGSRN